MECRQQNLKSDYSILLKGINRIRFIKKKQVHNHTQLTNTLTKIVSTLSPPPPHPSPYQPLQRNLTSRGKFKIAPIKRYEALQPTQDQSSITKHSQHQEQSSSLLNNKSIRNCSTDTLKWREMQESKWQNYKEMKKMERQFEKRKQATEEESLREMQGKVMKIVKEKQEGRKKIENNYFQYIHQIHLSKQQERERKARMTEKKYEEVESLQRQENEQIQMYESTLALEHHLKRVIEQQLKAREDKSTFVTTDINDSL